MTDFSAVFEQWLDQPDSFDIGMFEKVFPQFIDSLNRGDIRAAENKNGQWSAVLWVKAGILLGFRHGIFVRMAADSGFPFFDKDTYPLRPMAKKDNIRIVPGGSSVRSGSYLAPGVVVMPPAYVNVGAWVGQNTMIDSHALVGSCAQIGENVHLSAAAQIGGVLEPVGACPVIIEDDVLVGGNSGIYEGTIVRRRAVIGAGVILTRSIPVYDLVHQKVLRATKDQPLEIPAGAVVVPGSRPASGAFAAEQQIQLQCAVIVKYRDAQTDRASALESDLRADE